MKTSVNAGSVTNCPTCSRPLPSGAPAGLCPACLLAQGAESDSGAGGRQTRFVPPTLAEVTALFPQLEILRLLGAGGMGAVYQARQPALDRFVALKVLPAGGDGANFEERFNREARALARLSHPNIVAVHEFGQAGALHYFLMEYVDGANLRQLEQASRLSAREALQLIPQICDALQYAHDEGVVHRDIKPENVLVDRKGRVKIADFGLAKILGHDPEAARLTVEGQVMGTPHYMAPEQVERPLAVDHRADIYSLGVVFYEMLTGDLPLGKFAPPSRKVQVDVRLDEIVLRALENDPARRYQQASEVKSGVATVVETPAAAKLSTPTTAQANEDSPKPGVGYLRWLGIPAVVERDGEREVNFQGALGVFFVMLMASALMQQAVRWVTGTEYATTQLGFVTAAMMAIWAIRRTMNQPWGDEPPRRAANGTVILLPTKRRRYLWDGLMVVALLAFVVGSHYLKTRVINPRLGVEQNESPVHQPAALDPETGVLAATLPGGGTLELLALAPQETLPNGWWRPDGRPLTGSTVVVSGLNPVEPARSKTYFDFVFRADGLPAGAEVAQFGVGGGPTIRGGTVLMDGKTPPGAIRVRADLAKTAGLASFEVGLGLEPWQTLARHYPKKQASIRFRQAGNPAWDISLAHRAGTNGLAEVTGTYGPGQSGWQVRIVAVDHDGVAHTDVTSLSKIGPKALASTWTFRALPLTEVAEFQLQARRLHWVDFRAIAPNPKAPLPRGESLRLAEPIERTFDELIDFDTGRTVAFPVAIPGDNPFTSIGENILWAQENGFDAVAGRGELQVADADFAPLSNADWDALTAEEVINRLHQGTFHPRTLKELRPGEFPATYAYRTREQGYGMIQLVAFEAQRPGATVRLKRVVRPGTEPETAFGAPNLLNFDELVDFDTGHAADFPPAEPGSNPLAGIGENVLWAQENGFDAVAGVGKLELLGVTVAEINDAEWEAMTPAQAEARLAASGTKPHELTPQVPDRGNAPAYAFRTREGGVGLIRFVEFRNTRTGFTVQFRHAVRPGGAVEAIHARRDGKTGELVGRLPGRGVVTLSALRPAVAGSTEWWRPDGRPVPGMAPHFAEDFARTFPTNPPPGRLWQLLLRAEHLPSPEDHLHFEFPGALSRFFTGAAVVPRDGANPGAVFLHALWPDSATNAAVRVGIPMAQWHTIRSYEPLSRSFTKTSLGDDPRWNIELHAAGVGTKGAQITVVFGTNYPGWNLRVLATRLRQAPAVGTADVSVTNGPAVTRTFVFPELKTLDAVQNFEVQAQPLQWVEFDGIQLSANRRAEPAEPQRASVVEKPQAGATTERPERTGPPAPPKETVISILTPDWRPADDAEVALVRRGGFATLNREGFNEGQLQDAVRVQTYNRGRFRFTADNRVDRVFAVHSSGFAEASPGQLAGQTNLTLQPWGRIEGRWAAGDQPVVGREVALEPLAGMNGGALRFDFSNFRAETDHDGRFQFAHVPPGRVKVTRLLRTDRGNGNISWGLGRSAETEVRAGEVSQVALGVSGYRLSGTVVWPTDPVLAPHWRFTGRVHTPVPQPPAEVRGNRAALKRWQQTPEQQSLIKAAKEFPLSVLPDNSLYAEEIEPGIYTVDFFAYVDHSTEAEGYLKAQAAADPVTITVPAEPAMGTIDLGVITLRFRPPPPR